MNAASASVAFWDRIAPRYARDPIRNMPAYEATLGDVLSRLTLSDRVLEVGCGTGTTALRLAPHVAHLTATDASAAMIAIARDKLAAAGLPNLTFGIARAGDGSAGDSAGGTRGGAAIEAPRDAAGAADGFDAVLAFSLLHLVDDLPGTLAALRARLRPGGLFISKTACVGDMALPIRWALPVMRALGKAPPVLVFRAPALEAAVLQAGFTVDVSRSFARAPHARYLVARRPLSDHA